jgi:hypothetical protein
MNPQFPLYIPSKGRAQYMITSKYLSYMGVKHFIVVEPSEVNIYKAAIEKNNLLATVVELDMSYKNRYELCDDFGTKKSTGPGPARNFAWDHSIILGYTWHWVMDDNIRSFRRLNNNEKIKVDNGAIFRAMEDFVLRYENVGMAGPNYFMFASARSKMKPFIMNTRIYSCNLIRNDLPYRWRGRYNEDTILSLDLLKGKWCTIQFNAFLQEKMPTQVLKGGNSDEFYLKEGKKTNGAKYSDKGTIAKSQILVNVHPDVSTMTWKFQRWHHHVDYSIFKTLGLIKKDSISVNKGAFNYGMELEVNDETD